MLAEPAPVSVRDLVSDALAFTQAHARARGVAVTGEAPDDLTATTDLPHITRVLNNVVDNAIAESPPGGRIHSRASAGPDGVVLACRTREAAYRSRTLDAGFRGEASRRLDGEPSFSLGLAIGRAQATVSGARLVENASGGCRF